MASEAHRRELEEKVATLVAARFDGSCRAAFGNYDADGDGRIDKRELKALLTDAGVGDTQTRWAWTLGALLELDRDEDGTVNLSEFEAVFTKH